MLPTTYHRDHGQVGHKGSENDKEGPFSELVGCLSIIIAVDVLLGNIYRAANKVMSHSSSHGCGETVSLGVVVYVLI